MPELTNERKNGIAGVLFGNPANLEVYDPRPEQRVPAGGAWVMITRGLPPIEGRVDEHVRVGRIFYVEHLPGADEHGFLLDGQYRVMLHSPWGDVHLWPYEYSVMEAASVVELWAAEEIVFRPSNIDGARFSEIAFYARSRGIGLADAAVMALGTFSGPVGWFEPRQDLAEACEEMERRVHHPWPTRPALPPGRDWSKPPERKLRKRPSRRRVKA